MTHIPPTILDISRAVQELNEVSKSMHDGPATNRVASILAYQFAKYNGWGGRKNVTARDVRAALIVHGASPLVVEAYPRTIAARIRADFSDGQSTGDRIQAMHDAL